MSLLWAWAVLGSLPAPMEAFWQKDLSSYAAALADEEALAPAPPRALWHKELLALVSCQPLAPLAPAKAGAPSLDPVSAELLPFRTLLRLEQARRARLGQRAHGTVWKDLARPDFFRRSAPSLPADALRWPLEAERWPDEKTLAPVPASACLENEPQKPGQAATDLPSQELVRAFETSARPGAPRIAHTLRYQRAVLLWKQGRKKDAAETSAGLKVEELEPALQAHARLLRFALGEEPNELGPRLVALDELGEGRWHAAALTLPSLAGAGRFADVLQCTEHLPSRGPDSVEPLARWVMYARAQALWRTGQAEVALNLAVAELPRWRTSNEPPAAELRALVLGELAKRELDASTLGMLQALGPEPLFGQHLRRWASAALETGNLRLAQALADHLAGRGGADRTHGHVLAAELAMLRGDEVAFERAVSAVLELPERPSQSARTERDAAALQLGQQLLVRLEVRREPSWTSRVRRTVTRLENAVDARRKKAFAQLRTALGETPPPDRSAQAVAVGTVRVATQAPLSPPPELQPTFPEPFSLLALTATDGSLQAWFSANPTPEVSDAR